MYSNSFLAAGTRLSSKLLTAMKLIKYSFALFLSYVFPLFFQVSILPLFDAVFIHSGEISSKLLCFGTHELSDGSCIYWDAL